MKLKAAMAKWERCGQIRSFTFQPISIKVVKKIIRKMNRGGAECSLGLSNKIVKMSHAAIIHPMRHLINRIIVTQIYPNKWKLARVLALWKNKGSREDVTIYRPISLLSLLSKICNG